MVFKIIYQSKISYFAPLCTTQVRGISLVSALTEKLSVKLQTKKFVVRFDQKKIYVIVFDLRMIRALYRCKNLRNQSAKKVSHFFAIENIVSTVHVILKEREIISIKLDVFLKFLQNIKDLNFNHSPFTTNNYSWEDELV